MDDINNISHLIPSLNYIYKDEFNVLKQKNINFNSIHDEIKKEINNKIRKTCHNEISILKKEGILLEFLPEEISSEEYKDSLYLFKLLQKDKLQNEIDKFTICIENISGDISNIVDDYVVESNNIIKDFKSCGSFMSKKYSKNDFEDDTKAISYFKNCLVTYNNKYSEMINRFRLDYPKYI